MIRGVGARALAGRLASLLLAGALLGGCGVVGPRQVVVSAAASLTESFDALEEAFEAEHPDVDVVLNLGGSQVLAAQIVAGAPAALLASADQRSTATVVGAGLGLGDPVVFARNRLVIIVPPGNPDGIADLADLVDLDVVLGAPEVPVGAYAETALSRAGVELSPVSLEADTRGVVARVAQGDADAAIAYATDAVAIDGVDGVSIDDDLQPDITYEMVLLHEDGADFLEFLASVEARQILGRFGFTGP